MDKRSDGIRSRCVRVRKRSAETVRKGLLEAGLLRKDLQPARDQDSVFLPVLSGQYTGDGELCETMFKPLRSAPRSYRMLADVPGELRPLLPRAFDVIGQVIVIKIPDRLVDHRREIGRALLEARPEALSVAWDRGVKGEDRIRELEVIAGSPELETVHVEHGLKFALDPSLVYFSPRLATERLRVARMVRRGEAVLDMFSGVGPFAIHIAKRAEPSVVFAADINPAAIAYLERNMRLNRVSGVVPFLGDARELLGRIPPVDRIIMNLPHRASEFLPTAMRLLRSGGTVHLYELLEPAEREKRTAELASVMKREGHEPERVTASLVRGYSAFESHFVFDLKVR